MTYRKLRVAWSVFWGLAAVLLVVLWVRSYRTFDRIRGCLPRNVTTLVISYSGKVAAVSIEQGAAAALVRNVTSPKFFIRDSGPVEPDHRSLEDEPWPAPSFLGFGWMSYRYYSNMPNSEVGWSATGLHDRSWTGGSTGLQLPYYFMTMVAVVIAVAPWRRFSVRFSLRTLLVATTLVAILSGLAAYMFRT